MLEAWHYGWAVAIVVRVDLCGAIYGRAHDDEDEGVPALRPLTDDDEHEASNEHARRYATGQ